MKQGRARYPLTVWFQGGLLAVLLVLLTSFLILLIGQRAQNAADAFATGRFVKVLVATGEMESKLPASSGGGAPVAMNRDAYKEQRLQQLTAHMPETINTSPTTHEAKPESTPEENKTVPLEAVSLPLRKVSYPLKPAPNAALIDRRTDGQTLPVVSSDGVGVPWKEYAKPYPSPKEPHLLSLVITNLGMNSDLLPLVYGLDERLTLAFSPYAPSLRDKVKGARSAGFETWLNVPFQHENYPVHDYGGLTLLAEETPEHNLTLLHQMLASADGIVGLVAMPDEQFSTSAQMAPVFAELAKRGLLLTLYNPEFTPLANKAMLLHARPHIYSGSMPTTTEAFFRQNETLAGSAPHTILTLAPMPAVLQQLNGWIATLPAKGIALVPLSMQVQDAAETVKPAEQPPSSTNSKGEAHE